MESGCDPNSPECWCPCGCGCQNDPNGGDLPFDEKGLCASCSRGVHEVPPEGVRPLRDLIAVHKSILVHLQALERVSSAFPPGSFDLVLGWRMAGYSAYSAEGLAGSFSPRHLRREDIPTVLWFGVRAFWNLSSARRIVAARNYFSLKEPRPFSAGVTVHRIYKDFSMRSFLLVAGRDEGEGQAIGQGQTIEETRSNLPGRQNLVCVPREEGDDPNLLESWL